MANRRRSFDYRFMIRLPISSLNRAASPPRRFVGEGTRLRSIPALPRMSRPNTR